MLMASHIGDSPARPASTYESNFPAGPPAAASSSSHSHFPTAGGRPAYIPPRQSSTATHTSGSSAGAVLSPHSYGSLSRASPQGSAPPVSSSSYFHRSHDPEEPSSRQPPPQRAPHRSGSISGLRFMSITKAPRALKRLASAGGGALREGSPHSQQLSPNLANEDIGSSIGHGSVLSSTHHSNLSRSGTDLHSHHDHRADVDENRQQPKSKGFSKMFRLGSSSNSKSHARDDSVTSSENTLERKSSRLRDTNSVEQLALLAQGPVGGSSSSLRRKTSFTLRKRAPSLSNFAFPNSGSATPVTYIHSAANSDTGHSASTHRAVSALGPSASTDAIVISKPSAGKSGDGEEPRRHYPPPSASTGSAAASYGLSRSQGVGSIRRKPVPERNLSVDSSMLLQPSSFSSPSRIRLQEAAAAADSVHVAANAYTDQLLYTGHNYGYEPAATVDTSAGRPSQLSSTTSSPTRGDRSAETDEAVSPGSKTMSRIRKLSLRRKKQPKGSTAEDLASMPTGEGLHHMRNPSALDVRSPGQSSTLTGAEIGSPISYLSPGGTTDRDVYSPTSPSVRSVMVKGVHVPAPVADEAGGSRSAPPSSSTFSGLSRMTSLRKRTREASSPDMSNPAVGASRSTSPQKVFHAESDIQQQQPPAIDSQVEAANQAGFAAGPAGKPVTLKRSGSVGGNFLTRSNSFLSKASSSTFGGSRRTKVSREASAGKLSISGPVHLGADGEESEVGRLGGGATVITGGPAEAFAMLAARSANPGAAYVRSATTPVPGMVSMPDSPGSTPVALISTSPTPFSVMRRHGPSPVVDSGSATMEGPVGDLYLPKSATPSAHQSPVMSTRVLSPPPRKSLTSVRSVTPLIAPDVILPSDMKNGNVGGGGGGGEYGAAAPQVKMFVKAELAQQLDKVLQHPEAPTRKLAHNHSRTLTPHAHQVNTSMLPPDLIGEPFAKVSTSTTTSVLGPGSIGLGKGKLSRGSIDVGSGSGVASDAPIVTIGPLNGSGPSPRRNSTDAFSFPNNSLSVKGAETPLYGLGFEEGETHDLSMDSRLGVVRKEPRDVPTSPHSHTTASPAISSDSASDAAGLGGVSSSRQARPDRPGRNHGRARTVSLASLLGLGLPDSASTNSAATSAAGLVSPTVGSQGTGQAQPEGGHITFLQRLHERKGSVPEVTSSNLSQANVSREELDEDFAVGLDSRRGSVHDVDSGMGLLSPNFGRTGVASGQSSRPISYATSGHEASNGHHTGPQPQPHQHQQTTRAWIGNGPRRGSIGAAQALGSSAASGSHAYDRSTEDDFVPELPQTHSAGGTSARHSIQSQGVASSAHGHGYSHSRNGSNAYASSEAPSLDTDADAASVWDAQVVMASRIEVQRGGLGSGRNENHPAVASQSQPQHLDAGHPGDASERPVSLDDLQRAVLVAETEREAASESAKVIGGQTLRPHVVDDAPLRYSRQAELMSTGDGDDSLLADGRHGTDIDFSHASLTNADTDAEGEGSPSVQQGAESTRGSTGSRKPARKISYATAEEAIAARRQEQAEREERQRVRENKRQADRQARYATKKKTDPLLATRLALFGLQPPESGSSGAEQQPVSTDGMGTPLESLDLGKPEQDSGRVEEDSGLPRVAVHDTDAEYGGSSRVQQLFDQRPLLDASDLVDMDELDVPCESTGRDDAASMMVKHESSVLDHHHQVRVSITEPNAYSPGGGGGGAAVFSQDTMDRHSADYGGMSVTSDWYSSADSQNRHTSSLMPSVPVDAHRLSAASSQFPDFVTTMSHHN
ncbi:hypothetical protein A4X09_0g4714 [Tilletia walkeri]|uniref:Uncharacterized protein n=1 Tax=Tilletia walkeri TaxID=117179 RepID=A0A8X7N8B6_9BASI|nr:hypothetical protein A4X09_0g4714 [Tilletia walkeri]